MNKKLKSCPSSTADAGTVLLGVVNANGTVGYFSNKTEVTEELLEVIHKTGDAEKHFRFSGNCVESGCRQWDKGNCSVIKNIMHANDDLELEAQLPNCSIRSSCRWYYQEGAKACSFCPYIITNMLEEKKAMKA
jgi:hypothetical protein